MFSSQTNWKNYDFWLPFGIVLTSLFMFFRNWVLNHFWMVSFRFLSILIQERAPGFASFGTHFWYLFDHGPQGCLWRFLGWFWLCFWLQFGCFGTFLVTFWFHFGIENLQQRERDSKRERNIFCNHICLHTRFCSLTPLAGGRRPPMCVRSPACTDWGLLVEAVLPSLGVPWVRWLVS